jgi:hypothetical protein
MVATVKIMRAIGADPGTGTDLAAGNTRANAADTHSTAGTTYPITIPSSGTNYSFWVVTRLKVTAGTYSTIDNVRWYTDGTMFGTGVACKVSAATGYTRALNTSGGSTPGPGEALTTTNYTLLDAPPADAAGKTSGSPLTVAGSMTASATGTFNTATPTGGVVVYQIEVTSGASAGATGTETFTWLYDEV